MNKKAEVGSQIMFIGLFITAGIIAAAISIAIPIYFGSEYDYRALDASILFYKIQECFFENKINFSLEQKKFQDEIFEKCNLNEKVIKNYYYLQIKINDIEKLRNNDIIKCYLSEKNKEYPICHYSTFYINDEKIFLLAGSNQKSKTKT